MSFTLNAIVMAGQFMLLTGPCATVTMPVLGSIFLTTPLAAWVVCLSAAGMLAAGFLEMSMSMPFMSSIFFWPDTLTPGNARVRTMVMRANFFMEISG